MNTAKLMLLAKKHLGKGYMIDSAKLCYQDAESHIENGLSENLVQYRALKSIAYSVGIYHEDYLKAKQLANLITT